MPNGYALPTRKLVSQEDSALIARPDVPRSRFLGSWSRKTTFDAGWLVPFLVDEILPGDQMRYEVAAYLRMATPLFPLMDSQRVDTFFFFVPARILWSNWNRFMGEQLTPADSIDYTVPQIVSPAGGFAVNSVYDHMGLPVAPQLDPAQTISVNALPLRAYRMIYREWFKDQNLISSPGGLETGNGPDPVGTYVLYRRAKSHDYFTSALPWPQKFSAPTIGLSGQAAVNGIASVAASAPIAGGFSGQNTDGSSALGWTAYYRVDDADRIRFRAASTSGGAAPQIYADLSTATGVAINVFRQAFLVQELLERDARGGTRYTEIIKSHFGVTSPDFRLQRPEYIGGGSSPLNVTPIAQTAPSAGVTVGALGGAGTSYGEHRATYAATEHGYVIGLINVKSELSYQQGIPKMFKRRTRYDFYFPSTAGLGEQAITRDELFARGVVAEDTAVFGYQERWQELRTRYSEVTGQFRSGVAGTLDAWHLSQRFLVPGDAGYAGPPVLGQTFIEDTPPMARVLGAGALSVNQQFLADIHIRREAVRPVPMFGTPVRLGRF